MHTPRNVPPPQRARHGAQECSVAPCLHLCLCTRVCVRVCVTPTSNPHKKGSFDPSLHLCNPLLIPFSPPLAACPPHPCPPPFERFSHKALSCLGQLAHAHTHTHTFQTLQRWACELGQPPVYFSSSHRSRQLPLLFIVGGWMECMGGGGGGGGGGWSGDAGEGWPVWAAEAVETVATHREDKWMTLTFLHSQRAGQQPEPPPPPSPLHLSPPFPSPSFAPLCLSSSSGLAGAGMWPVKGSS